MSLHFQDLLHHTLKLLHLALNLLMIVRDLVLNLSAQYGNLVRKVLLDDFKRQVLAFSLFLSRAGDLIGSLFELYL